MKIIIVDENHGQTRTVLLKGWVRIALSICLLGLPVVLGYVGYQLSARNIELYNGKTAQAWEDNLDKQQSAIEAAREEAEEQLKSLAMRLATLQAHILRLDALGERLTQVAELDNGEFDFSRAPAVGGPETAGPETAGSETRGFEADSRRFDSAAGIAGIENTGASRSSDNSWNLMRELEELALQIEDRQQQLEVLDGLLFERRAQSEALVAGRPVTKGWLSSPYGRRIDPFTGNQAWHQGMDFATGEAGADVIAVATGVVTFSGERSGYGKLVEINHGNGYETLYGHGQDLLVAVGDVVRKGQVIALSGSTGRSTGPHVHFEVHKNGRVVDPASYIHRTNR